MTFAPIVFSEVFSGFIGIEVNWLAALIIAPTLPIAVVVSSLVTLVARDRKFAIAAVQSVSLKQLNSGTDFSDEISELELSGYLHNNLQSELLRIAHRLDTSSNSRLHVPTNEILSDLNTALDRSIPDVRAIQSSGFERIKALPEAWKGIADIDLEFSLEESLQPEKERILSGCLEEIITNSIRYGGATKLLIHLQFQNRLEVRISHNGNGSIHEGTGLGALWMSQISHSRPTIVKRRGQTLITFSL
jgi:signal transduction histidine kinase